MIQFSKILFRYVAILSNSTVNAKDRIALQFDCIIDSENSRLINFDSPGSFWSSNAIWLNDPDRGEQGGGISDYTWTGLHYFNPFYICICHHPMYLFTQELE